MLFYHDIDPVLLRLGFLNLYWYSFFWLQESCSVICGYGEYTAGRVCRKVISTA